MISVIIPIYNGADTLRRCVDSLLAQTYTALELLLCDDGSTDGTPALCAALAKEDDRVRVLRGENGGVAAARNRGIDAARGEYLAFVDCDDVVEPTLYEKLLSALTAAEADVAECGILYRPECGEPYCFDFHPELTEGTEACLRRFASLENIAPGPCNKLYRRDAVGDARFPAYAQGEDALFNWQVLHRVRRRVVIAETLYIYLIRDDSCAHSTRPGHELDEARVWMELYRQQEALSPGLGDVSLHKLLEILLLRLGETLRGKSPYRRQALPALKGWYVQYYRRYYSGPRRMTLRQRLGFLLFRVSPRAYFRYNSGRWNNDRREDKA